MIDFLLPFKKINEMIDILFLHNRIKSRKDSWTKDLCVTTFKFKELGEEINRLVME